MTFLKCQIAFNLDWTKEHDRIQDFSKCTVIRAHRTVITTEIESTTLKNQDKSFSH
jgi:hypothetical protein